MPDEEYHSAFDGQAHMFMPDLKNLLCLIYERIVRALLKIKVAYGGGTPRNSAAHLRGLGKRPIGAG